MAYSKGSCSTHWKSLCEAWRPIQRSKVTLGRLAVMNATDPQKRAKSDGVAPACSALDTGRREEGGGGTVLENWDLPMGWPMAYLALRGLQW